MTQWACPKCGCFDVEVVVSTWATLTQSEDGNFETDTLTSHDGSHEWNGDSVMRCSCCTYRNIALHFELGGVAMELNGWLVEASDDGVYLYITRDGAPGQIHIKCEDEGLIADLWSDDDPPVCCGSTMAMWPDLERE